MGEHRDYGEILSISAEMRAYLSEAGRIERYHCVILRTAAAYDWLRQWCPRRPPSPPPRVQMAGMQIRLSPYRQASRCVDTVTDPVFLRDFELAASARDALTARHDRGLGIRICTPSLPSKIRACLRMYSDSIWRCLRRAVARWCLLTWISLV